MKIKNVAILVAIDIFTLLQILIITLFPNNVLRIIIGLPLVLFFPGYTLIAVLFPRKGSLSGIERIALDFGLSIAVVPLIVLGLNYTSWGISLYPILISLAVFVIVMSAVAWYRAHRLTDDEQIVVRIKFESPKLSFKWSEQSLPNKIITVGLIVFIALGIATVIYVVNLPRTPERFTEFYVLNSNGEANNYPKAITFGQPVNVILVVTNQEYQTTTYKIEIVMNGQNIKAIGPFSLDAEDTWKEPESFTPPAKGDNQKIDFQLYENGGTQQIEDLSLLVNVN